MRSDCASTEVMYDNLLPGLKCNSERILSESYIHPWPLLLLQTKLHSFYHKVDVQIKTKLYAQKHLSYYFLQIPPLLLVLVESQKLLSGLVLGKHLLINCFFFFFLTFICYFEKFYTNQCSIRHNHKWNYLKAIQNVKCMFMKYTN